MSGCSEVHRAWGRILGQAVTNVDLQEDGVVLGDLPEHIAAMAQKDLATAARNEKQLVKEFKYNLAYNTGRVGLLPSVLSTMSTPLPHCSLNGSQLVEATGPEILGPSSWSFLCQRRCSTHRDRVSCQGPSHRNSLVAISVHDQ